MWGKNMHYLLGQINSAPQQVALSHTTFCSLLTPRHHVLCGQDALSITINWTLYLINSL